MDMMEILVLLLRAEVIKVKIDVNLPADFLEKLAPMIADNRIDGPEVADLIEAFRKGK